MPVVNVGQLESEGGNSTTPGKKGVLQLERIQKTRRQRTILIVIRRKEGEWRGAGSPKK